jgi:hypothetical protein
MIRPASRSGLGICRAADAVDAVDVSPEMIAAARSTSPPRVDTVVGIGKVRRHLFYRYSIVWHRALTAGAG